VKYGKLFFGFSPALARIKHEKAASMPIQNAQHFGEFLWDAIHGVPSLCG
jgi:hypothetical protein